MKLRIVSMLAAVALVAGCAATQRPSGRVEDVVQSRATVTAIDPQSRLVTLRDKNGEELIIQVPDAVRNFNQIKVGDEVPANLRYHYNIPLHVQLFNDFVAQTKLMWRALFPGEVHGYEFEARIARWGFAGGGFDYNSIANLETALKVTGEPTQF